MKALVTGATGFLGQWLVLRLLNDGYQVRIIKRRDADLDTLAGRKIEIFEGDVTNPESVVKACSGVEIVFHAAGVVAYTKKDRPLMEKVNVGGTQNVIAACKTQRVQKFIHISSVAAIGASFTPEPLDESAQYNLGSFSLGYFETKKMAEELVLGAARQGLFHGVSINPATIYGPGDAKKGSRKTQLKVAQGRFKFYPPGGVNVVSVEDVIEIIAQAATKGRSGERYIACGENLLIRDVFDLIAKHAGVEPPSIALPAWAISLLGKIGDGFEAIGKKGPLNSENAVISCLYHWFSGKKAQTEFGIQPKPAEYSIRQSVQWIKENGLLGLY